MWQMCGLLLLSLSLSLSVSIPISLSHPPSDSAPICSHVEA